MRARVLARSHSACVPSLQSACAPSLDAALRVARPTRSARTLDAPATFAAGAEGLLGVRELEDTAAPVHDEYLRLWQASSHRDACDDPSALERGRYCSSTANHELAAASMFYADAVLLWAVSLEAAPPEVRTAPDTMYSGYVRPADFVGVSGRVLLDESVEG